MSQILILREKAGLSQEKLAELVGVTQGAVHQWEKGLTTPATGKLKIIATILNCTVDELLPDSDNMQQ